MTSSSFLLISLVAKLDQLIIAQSETKKEKASSEVRLLANLVDKEVIRDDQVAFPF